MFTTLNVRNITKLCYVKYLFRFIYICHRFHLMFLFFRLLLFTLFSCKFKEKVKWLYLTNRLSSDMICRSLFQYCSSHLILEYTTFIIIIIIIIIIHRLRSRRPQSFSMHDDHQQMRQSAVLALLLHYPQAIFVHNYGMKYVVDKVSFYQWLECTEHIF